MGDAEQNEQQGQRRPRDDHRQQDGAHQKDERGHNHHLFSYR